MGRSIKLPLMIFAWVMGRLGYIGMQQPYHFWRQTDGFSVMRIRSSDHLLPSEHDMETRVKRLFSVQDFEIVWPPGWLPYSQACPVCYETLWDNGFSTCFSPKGRCFLYRTASIRLKETIYVWDLNSEDGLLASSMFFSAKRSDKRMGLKRSNILNFWQPVAIYGAIKILTIDNPYHLYAAGKNTNQFSR
ncbi:uncharacterized protein BO80DRAFT_438483 [Aspergillus ibericus CBS 121593]|uniref:Uncharacterized protein n=1 Tax=Aspergillus ibericus CBS 121593 TaxID=1448316 RepID=A0A395GM49_9EURO|nr:hypothetical protein BO80DRAFT_438483 [Aspergillus ibericus CBS 121593]RAK96575.1 hypothetical protein BO80DRAFT_438483 [Aspergillus ibericus CBS 121593]